MLKTFLDGSNWYVGFAVISSLMGIIAISAGLFVIVITKPMIVLYVVCALLIIPIAGIIFRSLIKFFFKTDII